MVRTAIFVVQMPDIGLISFPAIDSTTSDKSEIGLQDVCSYQIEVELASLLNMFRMSLGVSKLSTERMSMSGLRDSS